MKSFGSTIRNPRTKMVAISLLLVAGMTALVGRGVAREKPAMTAPPGLLMLVRAWDPASGELVGWMPMNRVTLTLGLLPGQKATPGFNLNDAVAVRFPYRPSDSVKYGRLRVVSKALTLEGRGWIPAEEAPNLVRIGKRIFYVKNIDFGDSKWQRPTVVNPVPQAGFNQGRAGVSPVRSTKGRLR